MVGMAHLVEIHGHRGARGLFPENTLSSFAGALAIGVDRLELDVGMTADDVVVVTHDPCLNPEFTRGLDGAWLTRRGPRVCDLSYAALSAFDVGRINPRARYARQFPAQKPEDGARIPSLTQVLARFPDARFSIEIKTDPKLTPPPETIADAVLDVIDKADAAERVLIESFDWRAMRYLRDRRPTLRRALLTVRRAGFGAALWPGGPRPAGSRAVARLIAAEGVPVWGPDHRALSEASVDDAHALGLELAPWTVNDPRDIARLIRWGVNAVVTDRPDLARHVIASQSSVTKPG